MSTTEKFCLRWNDFESNISIAFREIREDKDFFDVTLACDDEQISAHKVILSACSPFFRSVLKRNKHEHPLLYLKGVKYADLVAVLNFMYHGEVNVAQEDLNAFLAVAEDLKVKGLTQGDSNSDNATSTSRPGVKSKSPKLRDPPETSPSLQPPPPKKPRPSNTMPAPLASDDYDNDIQDVTPVKTEPLSMSVENSAMAPVEEHRNMAPVEPYSTELVDAEFAEDYGEYDAGYDADGTYDGSLADPNSTNTDGNKEVWDFVRSLMSVGYNSDNNKRHVCSRCQFETRNSSNLRSHIEAKHLPTDKFYSCDICMCRKRTWQRLLGHMRDAHNTSHNYASSETSLPYKF